MMKKICLAFMVASSLTIGFGGFAYSMARRATFPDKVINTIEIYWRSSIKCLDTMSVACANGYFVDGSTVHADSGARAGILRSLDGLAVDYMIQCINVLHGMVDANKIDAALCSQLQNMVLVRIAALHYMQTHPTCTSKLFIVHKLVFLQINYFKEHFIQGSGREVWSKKKCKRKFLDYLKRFPLLNDKDKSEYIDAFNRNLQGFKDEQESVLYKSKNETAYKELLERTNYQEPSYQLLIQNCPISGRQVQRNSYLAKDSFGQNEVVDKQDSDQSFGFRDLVVSTMLQDVKGSPEIAQQLSITRENFEQEVDFWPDFDFFDFGL